MTHARTSARLAALLLVAIALPASAELAPQQLTFNKQIRTKMFIGTPIVCDTTAVIGGITPFPPLLIARMAAYFAFCRATDSQFLENPPTGSTAPPLDARVAIVMNLKWKCQVGQALPTGLANITVVDSVGGPEPADLTGVVNPVATKNTMLADGKWSFVASGHPHPATNVIFNSHRIRLNTDIWHRADGNVSCSLDEKGRPSSRIAFTLNGTRFPSHRSWFYTVAGRKVRQAHNILQQAFSNLWFLPPVPAP